MKYTGSHENDFTAHDGYAYSIRQEVWSDRSCSACHAAYHPSVKVTGLARKLQVCPRFGLQIPVNGLNLAQFLGHGRGLHFWRLQPCNFYARRADRTECAPARGAGCAPRSGLRAPRGRPSVVVGGGVAQTPHLICHYILCGESIMKCNIKRRLNDSTAHCCKPSARPPPALRRAPLAQRHPPLAAATARRIGRGTPPRRRRAPARARSDYCRFRCTSDVPTSAHPLHLPDLLT